MNAWYVGATAVEVVAIPLARTLLNIPVVFFRGDDGEPAALIDICPHRAVPLHMGSVVGDRLRCIYHGLEFDRKGVCRVNPHIADGRPDGLRVQTFPIVQRYGLIWIWLGDPDIADSAIIPDYPVFEAPERFTTGMGYTWVAADYRLMVDNLFDLSHAEYLHPGSVGVPGASKVSVTRVERTPDRVTIYYNIPDVPPPVVWHAAWTKSERIDQYSSMDWRGGGSCYLDLTVTAIGSPRSEGWSLPFAHLLTPETENSTHYFWLFARDFNLDDDALTHAIAEVGERAFNDEDRPVLEAAQRSMERSSAKLRNITVGDSASAAIRRRIDKQAFDTVETAKAVQ
ncbi:aromatic ring-hydroxylating dioxygenase subunit alpha [Sphingomonas paeninsulae]|uniref:aromatic ring-hydroxylating dioxygenase subunit alpha n=1 Tax=Sphingomonas paeninsulae TaxID=2319844 RepID=UPI0013CEBBF9|nr:aromatic ring-hydroxylating dioxygenase subunit alpha [Sphingomonas paeninsulae]